MRMRMRRWFAVPRVLLIIIIITIDHRSGVRLFFFIQKKSGGVVYILYLPSFFEGTN